MPIIKYPLEVEVNVTHPSVSPPLVHAIHDSEMEIARFLLSRGADPNPGRPMISALNCKDKTLRLPFLKLLVEHGADVNQLYDIYSDEDMLFSALDWADEGECHDYLLSVGAKGSEELRKAGRKNGEVYDKSGKRIRDKPVPIIKPTILPATEYQIASDKVEESIRKQIIPSPASEHQMSESKIMPSPDSLVTSAIKDGNLQELRRLLERYPDQLHATDAFGTRYHWAVQYGHRHIVEYLIDAGVDLNYPAVSNPPEDSIQDGNMEIANLVLSRGADPNLSRPLISALNCDDKTLRLPFLKLLVEHVADVNQLFDIYGDEDMLFSALDWSDEGE